ncbi:MAG: hypothetical protein ACQ9ET_00170 [Nitrosomonadaceae bacterium]
MGLLIKDDYFHLIREDNLDIITGDDDALLLVAEASGESEMQSYLNARYDTEALFFDTLSYDISAAFGVGDFYELDAAAWEEGVIYEVGDLVSFTDGCVYKVIQETTGVEAPVVDFTTSPAAATGTITTIGDGSETAASGTVTMVGTSDSVASETFSVTQSFDYAGDFMTIAGATFSVTDIGYAPDVPSLKTAAFNLVNLINTDPVASLLVKATYLAPTYTTSLKVEALLPGVAGNSIDCFLTNPSGYSAFGGGYIGSPTNTLRGGADGVYGGDELVVNGTTITEGVDWDDQGTSALNAAAVKDAINGIPALSSVLTATVLGSIITVTSNTTGPAGNLITLATGADGGTPSMVVSGPFLTGGDESDYLGDIIEIGGTTLTEGVDWTKDVDSSVSALNLRTAINANPTISALVVATSVGTVITLTAVAVDATGNSISMGIVQDNGSPSVSLSGGFLTGGDNGGLAIDDYYEKWGIKSGLYTVILAGAGLKPADPLVATLGDTREALIKRFLIDIVIYEIHSRINPRKIPEFRITRRDDAIQWLMSVADPRSGVDPGFAEKVFEDNQDAMITYGSNDKLRHGY